MSEFDRQNRRRGDDCLAVALAAGATIKDAAQQSRVSEPTARRRLADPTFRRRVSELRAELVERAVAKLTATMTDAADCLRRLLKARGESIRLGAARSILELACKLRETTELEARLAELEHRVKPGEKKGFRCV